MVDFLKRLFGSEGMLGVLATSAVVGLFAGSAMGAHQFKHAGWSGVFRAAVIGVGVAVVVGFGVADYINSEMLRLAIVGACAAIGEDVIEGLKAFGRAVRKDPLGAVSRLIDALRGVSRKGD